MKGIDQEVLEKSAVAYVTVPLYLVGEKSKQDMAYALIDMIDALDEIEFARSGTPLYDIIRGDMPGKRKEAIIEKSSWSIWLSILRCTQICPSFVLKMASGQTRLSKQLT